MGKYPITTLDYTIITPIDTTYEEFEKIINEYESDIIIKRELIDIFENEENKKITIRYNVGSFEKTLNSEELDNFKKEFINHIISNKLNIVC